MPQSNSKQDLSQTRKTGSSVRAEGKSVFNGSEKAVKRPQKRSAARTDSDGPAGKHAKKPSVSVGAVAPKANTDAKRVQKKPASAASSNARRCVEKHKFPIDAQSPRAAFAHISPNAQAKKFGSAANDRGKKSASQVKGVSGQLAKEKMHSTVTGNEQVNKTVLAAKHQSGTPDAGDLFFERRRPKISHAIRRRAKQRSVCIALDVLFVTIMLSLGTLFVFQSQKNGMIQDMKAAVARQTFYEGTLVDGVDVSGMTLTQATEYWKNGVEAELSGRAVTVDGSATVNAAQLGYESDYQSLLSDAWSMGRSGTLEERYRLLNTRRVQPAEYTVHRQLFDEALVDLFVAQAAERIDAQPVNASVESFDAESFKFTFSEEKTGRRLDSDALKTAIQDTLYAGGGNVQTSVEMLQPEITAADVQSRYGMIAGAVTNASSSSSARLSNIKLAMQLINGTCVKPGETFSFNQTVGRRTTDRGFKKATAYSGGEVTEQVGGGICQVSTTLFNAAVKSDMEIVERHHHSLTVAYVDRGKDATVNWGNQDFKFKNTSDDDVYVCCMLTDNKRVRFGIFGKLLPNGETISVETVTTKTIKYETEYQPTAFLAPGETSVIQTGKNGYVAEAYKVRWDKDGNEISREHLCTSRYQMKNEIIQYGQ